MATRQERNYGPITIDEICCRLRAGQSLLEISRSPGMPHYRTLRSWITNDYMGFASRYDESKRIGILVYAEQALDEARNTAKDYYTDEHGRRVFDRRHVWRSKLIVDTVKWQVGKMLPKLSGGARMAVTGRR